MYYSQKVINIRNNTHTALFSDATSLLYVNELFYWSNGSVIMREDYFSDDQKYYQTIYPEINFKVNLLISNFIDLQPIPSPRNPSKSSKVSHKLLFFIETTLYSGHCNYIFLTTLKFKTDVYTVLNNFRKSFVHVQSET